MNWTHSTLGDVCDSVGGIIQTGPFGSQLHESDYTVEGVPVVMPKDIADGRIVPDTIARIRATDAERLYRHKLAVGDIVYGRRGDIGRQALVRAEHDGWLCGTGCLRISLGESILEPSFLHYYLRQGSVIGWIASKAIGATLPNLNTGILRSVPVSYPDLAKQRRISSVLSAYDDLIENNVRRISLLEEMARAFYRKDFVDFRGSVASSEGLVALPDGWERCTLDALISDHIGGGWGKETRIDDFVEPAWVIRGTDLPEGRYCQVESVPHRYHTGSNVRNRVLLPGDIVFEVSGGSKGQPVGRALLFTTELQDAFNGEPVICASFCKKIRINRARISPTIFYLSLLEAYENGEIERYQVQSTGISNFKWTDYITNTMRVVPPAPIRIAFDSLVEPLLSQIGVLGRQISNLRRTRDLLLPRLLSGQINLEDVEPAA